MEPHLGTPDPQWDFALMIRAELERFGRYATDVDTRDAQAVADIHWAARQAGRLLGVDVKVELSAPFGHADSTVTAVVRAIHADETRRRLAEEGLQRLLESVRATQAGMGAMPSGVAPRVSPGSRPWRRVQTW